jgi:hypothetical protein
MLELIGCPKTSVRNYHYSLRNNPEHSFHLLCGGSLKPQNSEWASIMVYYAYVTWISELCSSRIQERKRFANSISYRLQTARIGRYKTIEVRWLLPPLTSNQSEIKQSSASSLFTKIRLRCPVREHLHKWVRYVELLIIDNQRLSTICTWIMICESGTVRKWKTKIMEVTMST